MINMNITSYKTKLFKEKDDLAAFIAAHVPALKEKSVLAVSSKVLSLSLGLTADEKDFEKLIKQESQKYLKTALCYFTIKENMVMTNAGIDKSNIKNKIILLPKNTFKEAAALRAKLQKIYRVKRLGVIITDSMILPLRAGVTGAAVGYAGFKGVKNYVGKKDLFGRKMEMTLFNYADSLAAAATAVMGEGSEKKPLAVIENAPVVFTSKTNEREIKYPLKKDLYYPFFKKLFVQKR